MRIVAKWGFGNAPLKKHHRDKTIAAIRFVLEILKSLPESPEPEHLEAISYVKGQFTRTIKQDQWDWYTVWALLGRPSRGPANRISKLLKSLRSALKNGELPRATEIRNELLATSIRRYLENFLVGNRFEADGPNGYIYILSTRSLPNILKIGMTKRTVEERVKEINSSTGIFVPYGIRAAWQVDAADEIERELHGRLADYRVRPDREFFEIDFNEASRMINDYLRERRS